MVNWESFGYMSIAVFIAVILTEIVKYPIKRNWGHRQGTDGSIFFYRWLWQQEYMRCIGMSPTTRCSR